MYEVEVKVRAEHAAVESALEEQGATRRELVEQIDTYFDAPHRDMAARDEALRLRRERLDGDEQAVLTYKGPLVEAESKTREEVETTVGSPDQMAEILSALGFRPAANVEKTRRRYDLGDFTVSLDTVSGLGTFVEIETEAPKAAIESAREKAIETLAELGLDADDQLRTSYLELLLESK